MIATRKGTEPGLQTHSGPFNLAAHLTGESETALHSHKRFGNLVLNRSCRFGYYAPRSKQRDRD
jgi:hypothetical protein